ncbi:MAG: hypothetical protein M1818_002066 [Claussenomyces sp. TS43310]|nr:MAG: hypothetical protein M1818_002066 [Claussenomyces sp. TS43310]
MLSQTRTALTSRGLTSHRAYQHTIASRASCQPKFTRVSLSKTSPSASAESSSRHADSIAKHLKRMQTVKASRSRLPSTTSSDLSQSRRSPSSLSSSQRALSISAQVEQVAEAFSRLAVSSPVLPGSRIPRLVAAATTKKPVVNDSRQSRLPQPCRRSKQVKFFGSSGCIFPEVRLYDVDEEPRTRVEKRNVWPDETGPFGWVGGDGVRKAPDPASQAKQQERDPRWLPRYSGCCSRLANMGNIVGDGMYTPRVRCAPCAWQEQFGEPMPEGDGSDEFF